MAKKTERRMGEIKFLLDTNPIILALNNKFKLKERIYLISFITELELLSFPNLTKNEENQIKDLLKNFLIIDINSTIKNITIALRKKYKLKLPDSIVVATAIENNAILITEDKKLKNIKEIEVKGLSEVRE